MRHAPLYAAIAGIGFTLVFLATATHFAVRRRQRERFASKLTTVVGNLNESREALRVSESRFRDLVENTNDIVWEVDEDGRYVYCSPNVHSILGYTADELVGRSPLELMPAEDVNMRMNITDIISRKQPFSLLAHRVLVKDGGTRVLECSGKPIFDSAGQMKGHRGIDRDITERRKLEDQLRHSQKMEAVGQLSGGLAHDFNNILTVILGYAEVLSESKGLDADHAGYVRNIELAATKAKSLTQRLLTFSRKQMLQPKVVNLNSIVTQSAGMLLPLIGEHIRIRTLLTPDAAPVRVDPDQMEQVLINLCVNARDAMPDGGELVISTQNISVAVAECDANPELRPGAYIMLSVKDTGCGMDSATVGRIFEPFFTTKPRERGTGLGLATVYGIVKQSGGFIAVESQPGKGTQFRVYVPAIEGPFEVREDTARNGSPPALGTETVLVVEDEASVREIVATALRRSGYDVLLAATPGEAITIADTFKGPIHLLLTDVVLPEVNGGALAETILARRAETKVLYMSGYSNEALFKNRPPGKHVSLIEKPFDFLGLSKAVQDALVAAPGPL